MESNKILLEPEQAVLLNILTEAHERMPRSERQDFKYSPAYIRFGARPRSVLEEAINNGGSVGYKGQIIMRVEDIPWNLDHDMVFHPGFPNGSIDVAGNDLDILHLQKFIHFKNDESFFITPEGIAFCRFEKIERDSDIAKIDQDVPQNGAIYTALLRISPSLASSYLQVKLDIEDEDRSSWAGTAHEIREVLSTSLKLLAPDQDVTAQSWYTQEPRTSGPTQKQRVRYILQQHNAGSKEREVAEQVVKLEEMVGDLVRSTYSRASDAAHTFKNKKEIMRIVKYFDAFAYDLFNID